MKFCNFCNAYNVTLYPLKSWDKDTTSYYCSKHIDDAKSFQETQKRNFIDYYKDPNARSFLSSENLALWEKLRQTK